MASIPDTGCALVSGCEHVKQVLDVDILLQNPSRLFELGLVRIKINRQPVKVVVPGCAEEWGSWRIFGADVFSNWRQHRDKAVVPMCQGKNTEFVKDRLSVRDGKKNQVEVFLMDALGEEGDDLKKAPCTGAKALECWGSKREVYGCAEARVVICLKHLCSLGVPLL